MEFGIFNLMGSRDPAKSTAEVFAEVAEQTRLADELGYTISWFAEQHFSNYCLSAAAGGATHGSEAKRHAFCRLRFGCGFFPR